MQSFEGEEDRSLLGVNDLRINIYGAADSKTGTPKHNQKLSVRRAKYIAKLLMKD